MSLGRRKVGLQEQTRWVFNRMADVYDARPAYPPALLDRLATLARDADQNVSDQPGLGDAESMDGSRPPRIADLGAGIGHLAVPLADQGFDVVAVEPAKLMLDRLQARAAVAGVRIQVCHASAEQLPLADASIDLAVVADALHFLDAELTAREISRVLVPGGALALVSCEFADTSFMRGVVRAMEDAVPRRPREMVRQMIQVSSITKVPLTSEEHFSDETAVDHTTLDRILRSISFIGPAMNPARFANFRTRVHALAEPPVWARRFVLRWGRLPRPRFAVRSSGSSGES